MKGIMKQRRIILHSFMTHEFRITNNRSIMACAHEHAAKEKPIETLKLIKYV